MFIVLTFISCFQKLIKRGVGRRAGGLENYSKINNRGGETIIRYSRVYGAYIFIFIVDCFLELSFQKSSYISF